MFSTRVLTGVALVSLLLAGCGGNGEGNGGNGDNGGDNGDQTESPETQSPEADEEAQQSAVEVSEEFQPYSDDAAAITYDEQAVPEGSTVDFTATSEDEDDGMEFNLAVSGLEADREFGAHVHTDPCGEDPDAAGPHYQNEQAPDGEENNPQYANDDNEVWLDFSTDGNGDGEEDSDVDWSPREGEANSVVIHAEETATPSGEAGSAGDRLACVNAEL